MCFSKAAAHTLESYPLAGLLLGPLLKWNTRQNGDQVFEPFIVNDYLWGYYENSTAFLGDDATNGLFYGVRVFKSQNMRSFSISVYYEKCPPNYFNISCMFIVTAQNRRWQRRTGVDTSIPEFLDPWVIQEYISLNIVMYSWITWF